MSYIAEFSENADSSDNWNIILIITIIILAVIIVAVILFLIFGRKKNDDQGPETHFQIFTIFSFY